MRQTIIAIAIILIGCGQPQYPYAQPKLKAEASKGAFGGAGSLDIGSDFNGELVGFERDASGVTRIERLTVMSAPSTTLAQGYVPVMDAYGRQQVNYGEIRRIEWAGFNQELGPGFRSLLSGIAPALTSYFDGRAQVDLARANRPSLLAELAQIVVMNRAGIGPAAAINPQPIINSLPADIVRDAQAAYPDAGIPSPTTTTAPAVEPSASAARRRAPPPPGAFPAADAPLYLCAVIDDRVRETAVGHTAPGDQSPEPCSPCPTGDNCGHGQGTCVNGKVEASASCETWAVRHPDDET